MDREEFQKKYDNSILVCCTENSIKKVFNICDLMDLTASNSKQATAILIGEQTAKSPLFTWNNSSVISTRGQKKEKGKRQRCLNRE